MLTWGDPVKPTPAVRVHAYAMGAIYAACTTAVRWFVGKPTLDLGGRRVLYYAMHQDLIPLLMARRCFGGVACISDNSRGGYAGSLAVLASGLHVFRFSRGGSRTPYRQILDFLVEYPDAAGIFTDAGRRDGRVRPSLIGLARESGRPLIPIRIRANRGVFINLQAVPLPFSRVTIECGDVVEVTDEDGRDLADESIMATLQSELSRL